MTVFSLLLTCMIALGSPGLDAWRWPLGPPAPQVLRGFSPPAAPWGAGHRGVDLAARPGQAVFAAGPGRVAYANGLAGRGVVTIDHGPLRTTYLPVRPSVHEGRRVTSGTRIGALERGLLHCPMSCLHWGLLRGTVYLNPLNLVQHQVRLLPLWQQSAPTATPRPLDSPSSQPKMALRDAATATGGALSGMVLAFALAFAWRRTRLRFRLHRRRRQPPGVINLSQERHLRRTPYPSPPFRPAPPEPGRHPLRASGGPHRCAVPGTNRVAWRWREAGGERNRADREAMPRSPRPGHVASRKASEVGRDYETQPS